MLRRKNKIKLFGNFLKICQKVLWNFFFLLKKQWKSSKNDMEKQRFWSKILKRNESKT